MSAAAQALRPRRAEAFRRRLRVWLAALAAATAAAWAALELLPLVTGGVRLAVNVTDSLPGTLYLVVPLGPEERLARGDRIAFLPPPNPTYPEGMPFIKIVMGLPGDHVRWEGRTVVVAGRALGVAKGHALDGRPLARGPEGVIPEGRYFVWTPHEDSYDSRYAEIGWIPRSRILGRARRLL